MRINNAEQFIILMMRQLYSCTMDRVIDRKPARDDRSSLSAKQRVNVNVNFPYSIISTVSIMVEYCDLQWLILQVLIINLDSKRGKGELERQKT